MPNDTRNKFSRIRRPAFDISLNTVFRTSYFPFLSRKGVIQMLILGFDRFKFKELFPELCFWQCCAQEDFFLFYRMNKYQVERVEVDARIRIGFGKSVLDISSDGTAHRSELNPNLMRSTGDGAYFKQPVVVKFSEHLVVEFCLLRARHFLVVITMRRGQLLWWIQAATHLKKNVNSRPL